ncbi:TetR/AcrR family transcriptional regulator [Planomicrobium sp. CPCC 101110]|uniref:TetR/AcrR family transcriptional regulator n=1 Tax=Planomicrobium sp. CPCC 101110 TaxID=2599619 RepID=UPI0011B50353|nr:TetR/AcrR family transcriptional regulator [Planomicrobium sp. CPCC 101110]TWT25894.1 TetR/AcrR family transcriptional regulator [Planomicrobium sp. CPCC 101110]
MKLTDLRIIKTKEALREALLALLNTKALNAITVTEICQLAKVNRGTFYSHYGQIEDLFEEYLEEIMEDLAVSYREPYRHGKPVDPESLNPATIRIFHHIESYKKFYRIVLSKQVPLAYYYLLHGQVCELMKKDVEIQTRIKSDLAMVCAYQANAILGMVIEWHRQDFTKSAVEMNQLLVHILNREFN